MLRNVWLWILNNVFHIQSETRQKDLEENGRYATEYQRIDDINFNAIFSNKLSNYVINDSLLNIEGNNPRVELLNMTGASMWKKAKKITSMAFGYGGVFLVPYVKKGKIFYTIVPQERVSIDATEGDLITGVTILADRKDITNSMITKTYLRWTNYRIEKNNVVIEQKFSDENGKTIPVPDFWKNIQLKQTISNVDRALCGYIKSPINNRKSNDKYGVPITYGCEATINEIKKTMKQLTREFELKEAFVGADVSMFGGKDALPINGLYRKIDSGEDGFWEVFDPAFRDSSYMTRLQELYTRLEHEVGTSAGIISQVETNNATATEIKRAMYDTFTIVDDMRSNIEKGLEDFFYSCNILANAYNLSAQGEYELNFDWDYSLLEDSQETYSQLIQGLSQGVISKVELRQWLKPDEDLKDAQKAIDEIQASEPSIEELIGQDKESIGNKEPKKEDKKEKEENR